MSNELMRPRLNLMSVFTSPKLCLDGGLQCLQYWLYGHVSPIGLMC